MSSTLTTNIDGKILYQILGALLSTHQAQHISIRPPDYAVNPKSGRMGVMVGIHAVLPPDKGDAGSAITKLINERTRYHCPDTGFEIGDGVLRFYWRVFIA